MLLRFFLFIAILYLASKLVQNLFKSTEQKNEIRGNPRKNEPLDLSDKDVEDADFEEVEEK